jgi:tetratricopeptide (TPR) repeat protein
MLAREQGDLRAARGSLEASLFLHYEHEDARSAARVLRELGLLLAQEGDHTAARARYLEALSLAQDAGDRGLEGLIHRDLGSSHLDHSSWDQGWDEIPQALAMLRAQGDQGSSRPHRRALRGEQSRGAGGDTPETRAAAD